MVTHDPGQGGKVQNLRGVGRLEPAALHDDPPSNDHLEPPLLLVAGACVISSGNAELF